MVERARLPEVEGQVPAAPGPPRRDAHIREGSRPGRHEGRAGEVAAGTS